MAKKSPAADESDTPQRLDADFRPLPDEEIAAYADRESLTLIDLIVITNGQIRPGKAGLFVATEHEISVPPLTEFDLATVSVPSIKEMSETIEESRLKLPCTPYELAKWAEDWGFLAGPDFVLPRGFVSAVTIPKKPNETPDERAVRCSKSYEREIRLHGKRGALGRAHKQEEEKISRQYFAEICERGRKILKRQGESQG